MNPPVRYWPLNADALTTNGSPDKVLAWLMALGNHIALIPGTSSPRHLRELVATV